jgi:transposase, IS5 family
LAVKLANIGHRELRGGPMPQQGSFSQAEYASKKKQTRRDKFLAEMEQVVPWPRLVARLQPLYPKGERGRPPVALERMLRVHFLQQWYALADQAMEEALYDSQAMRGFAGIDLTVDAVPDETTILNFRHWLERHDLSRSLFEEVSAMLEERGLLMRQGTIVDATIIAAPSSTKNKEKARDPDMHQTKKGNQWHFGMKAHIGVDVASGLVHTVTGTAANEADITQTAALLPGEEDDVFGDAGYTGADKRPELADRDVSPAFAGAGCATSRSSAVSSKTCRKPYGIWRSRSSGRYHRCGRWSSIPSISSRTASTIRSCAIAAVRRTRRSYILCLLWLIW